MEGARARSFWAGQIGIGHACASDPELAALPLQLTHSTASTEAALPYWPSHNIVVFCTYRAARDELRMRNAAREGKGAGRLRREAARGAGGMEQRHGNYFLCSGNFLLLRCLSLPLPVSLSPSLLFFMSNYNCFG